MAGGAWAQSFALAANPGSLQGVAIGDHASANPGGHSPRLLRSILKRFPDVRALAATSLDDVLSLWSGLGYYSRARNLHRCAQRVVDEFDGVFPATVALLKRNLPGIGRSTAGAIAALFFAAPLFWIQKIFGYSQINYQAYYKNRQ